MEIETVTIKTENFDQECYPQELQTCNENRQDSINADKPFQCGICGHCTTSNILLKVHMKMHLIKRQHQCSVCKQTFSFITELNKHMGLHSYNFNQSILKENKQKDSNKTVKGKPTKQFENTSPLTPLCEKEKYLLIQYIEKLGLNVKYKEMENIKIFLRSGWAKMVELFAENNFDRNPDKLARTYFHMKNQAKMHIERFYRNKKLPKPRKIDYLFIKLCPSEFEGLGLDLYEVQEDSKIYEESFTEDDEKNYEDATLPLCAANLKEEISTLEFDEKHINDVDFLLNDEPVGDSDNILPIHKPSTSKRIHPEGDTEELPNKIQRLDCEDEYMKSLNLKFLIADEKRRQKEHELEMKKMNSEIKCKEEMHKKEMELKSLEILLLTRKLQANC